MTASRGRPTAPPPVRGGRSPAGPWRALGTERTHKLSGLLQPLVSEVVASGTLPRINPIGLVVDEVGEEE